MSLHDNQKLSTGLRPQPLGFVCCTEKPLRTMKPADTRNAQRIVIYLTEADLNWLEEMRNDIRGITGKRAPARATLLSLLVQAIR